MKALIDTNVILDFFLSREPHNDAAKKLFKLAYQENLEIFTTASSITDIYYITAKRLGNDAAREVLWNLFNLLTVITVGREDCLMALGLPMSDYEDALIAACASKVGADCIVSRDADFLKAGGTPPVIMPARFLDRFALVAQP